MHAVAAGLDHALDTFVYAESAGDPAASQISWEETLRLSVDPEGGLVVDRSPHCDDDSIG